MEQIQQVLRAIFQHIHLRNWDSYTVGSTFESCVVEVFPLGLEPHLRLCHFENAAADRAEISWGVRKD